MIKSLIVGIIIGVFVIAPFIQDPTSGIEIGKIILDNVIGVGVPLIKDVVAETSPIVTDAVKDVVKESTPIVIDSLKESIGLDQLIGGGI